MDEKEATNEMNLKQIVVFAILMENNDGIIGKHPSYILEKFRNASCLDHPELLLDNKNFANIYAGVICGVFKN